MRRKSKKVKFMKSFGFSGQTVMGMASSSRATDHMPDMCEGWGGFTP